MYSHTPSLIPVCPPSHLPLSCYEQPPQAESEASSKRIAELEAFAARDKAELEKLVKQMGESMQQNVSLFAQARKSREEGVVMQREVAELQARLSSSELLLATKGDPLPAHM